MKVRVGIKPRFYHKAKPGRLNGFYEGGFLGFYGFYLGFIILKVYHDSHNQLLPYSFSVQTVLVLRETVCSGLKLFAFLSASFDGITLW